MSDIHAEGLEIETFLELVVSSKNTLHPCVKYRKGPVTCKAQFRTGYNTQEHV